MTQIIFMNIMIINAIIFTQIKHPLMLGLILLKQTIFVCLMLGSLSYSYWFSYILFLIFIGGMLILFIYMASMYSNEKMKISMKFFMIWMTSLITMLMIYLMITDNFYFNSLTMNLEMNELKITNQLIQENFLLLSKMYDSPNNMLTILMIIYLLLTLIIIVKITNSFMGPLRKKN